MTEPKRFRAVIRKVTVLLGETARVPVASTVADAGDLHVVGVLDIPGQRGGLARRNSGRVGGKLDDARSGASGDLNGHGASDRTAGVRRGKSVGRVCGRRDNA